MSGRIDREFALTRARFPKCRTPDCANPAEVAGLDGSRDGFCPDCVVAACAGGALMIGRDGDRVDFACGCFVVGASEGVPTITTCDQVGNADRCDVSAGVQRVPPGNALRDLCAEVVKVQGELVGPWRERCDCALEDEWRCDAPMAASVGIKRHDRSCAYRVRRAT